MTKQDKIAWINATYLSGNPKTKSLLEEYYHPDKGTQSIFDGFSENTISNFHIPYGIAPNFLIDGEWYAVPMVIEESSVVAAASSAAKYWSERGGFKTQILGTEKKGQVSFRFMGGHERLSLAFPSIKEQMLRDTEEITKNMRSRGGGIKEIALKDLTSEVEQVFQIIATFETCDSMGANFINTCLEQFACTLKNIAEKGDILPQGSVEIVMSILSNYTDNCLVNVEASCSIIDLRIEGDSSDFMQATKRFKLAVDIAKADPNRAVTHNKGIFNGIDAVVLATGNDFRAIEACGHAYASRSGQYASLSYCKIEGDLFTFGMTIPLALGTVGGLTNLHPLARLSLDILNKPSSQQLMKIVAAVGLAQNFAAVRSLTTTGIQKGHMKMHLQNILNQLEASQDENAYVCETLQDKQISFNLVRRTIEEYRTK